MELQNSSQYCRFCGEEKPRRTLIDVAKNQIAFNDVSTKLHYMNANYVRLDEQGLPTTLCGFCYQTLDKTHNFLMTVKKVQSVLRMLFQTQKEIKEEGITENSRASTPDSPKLVIDISQDEEHMALPQNSNHNQDKQANPTALNAISSSNYKLVIDGVTPKPKNSVKNSGWAGICWKCQYCEKTFDARIRLTDHCMEAHNLCAAFKCAICGVDINEFKDFVCHARRHNQDLRKYCEYCNCSLSTNKRYYPQEHLKQHLKEIMCKYCAESFSFRRHLLCHLEKQAKRITKETDKNEVNNVARTLEDDSRETAPTNATNSVIKLVNNIGASEKAVEPSMPSLDDLVSPEKEQMIKRELLENQTIDIDIHASRVPITLHTASPESEINPSKTLPAQVNLTAKLLNHITLADAPNLTHLPVNVEISQSPPILGIPTNHVNMPPLNHCVASQNKLIKKAEYKETSDNSVVPRILTKTPNLNAGKSSDSREKNIIKLRVRSEQEMKHTESAPMKIALRDTPNVKKPSRDLAKPSSIDEKNFIALPGGNKIIKLRREVMNKICTSISENLEMNVVLCKNEMSQRLADLLQTADKTIGLDCLELKAQLLQENRLPALLQVNSEEVQSTQGPNDHNYVNPPDVAYFKLAEVHAITCNLVKAIYAPHELNKINTKVLESSNLISTVNNTRSLLKKTAVCPDEGTSKSPTKEGGTLAVKSVKDIEQQSTTYLDLTKSPEPIDVMQNLTPQTIKPGAEKSYILVKQRDFKQRIRRKFKWHDLTNRLSSQPVQKNEENMASQIKELTREVKKKMWNFRHRNVQSYVESSDSDGCVDSHDDPVNPTVPNDDESAEYQSAVPNYELDSESQQVEDFVTVLPNNQDKHIPQTAKPMVLQNENDTTSLHTAQYEQPLNWHTRYDETRQGSAGVVMETNTNAKEKKCEKLENLDVVEDKVIKSSEVGAANTDKIEGTLPKTEVDCEDSLTGITNDQKEDFPETLSKALPLNTEENEDTVPKTEVDCEDFPTGTAKGQEKDFPETLSKALQLNTEENQITMPKTEVIGEDFPTDIANDQEKDFLETVSVQHSRNSHVALLTELVENHTKQSSFITKPQYVKPINMLSWQDTTNKLGTQTVDKTCTKRALIESENYEETKRPRLLNDISTAHLASEKETLTSQIILPAFKEPPEQENQNESTVIEIDCDSSDSEEVSPTFADATDYVPATTLAQPSRSNQVTNSVEQQNTLLLTASLLQSVAKTFTANQKTSTEKKTVDKTPSDDEPELSKQVIQLPIANLTPENQARLRRILPNQLLDHTVQYLSVPLSRVPNHLRSKLQSLAAKFAKHSSLVDSMAQRESSFQSREFQTIVSRETRAPISLPLRKIETVDKSWTGYPWACRLCEQMVFSKVCDLRKHSREEHKMCFTMKCADCDDEFDDFTDFVSHVELHRRFLQQFCPSCNSKVDRHSRGEHMTNHGLTCRTCGDTMPNLEALRHHTSSYATLSLSSKKRQSRKGSQHINVHYPCQKCGQVFECYRHLHKHTGKHMDAEFLCDICMRFFKDRTQLVKHYTRKDRIGPCSIYLKEKEQPTKEKEQKAKDKAHPTKVKIQDKVVKTKAQPAKAKEQTGKKKVRPTKVKIKMVKPKAQPANAKELLAKEKVRPTEEKEHPTKAKVQPVKGKKRPAKEKEPAVTENNSPDTEKGKLATEKVESVTENKPPVTENMQFLSRKPFQCVYCFKKYADKRCFDLHLKIKHRGKYVGNAKAVSGAQTTIDKVETNLKEEPKDSCEPDKAD